MALIFCDNRFVSEKEATLPITDRGFQLGDGAYATIQVREGIPLFLQEHLKQLDTQCLNFNLCMPTIERAQIEELIRLNRADQGIWRLKIFVTGGDSAEMRLPKREGRVIMILKPFTAPPLKPLVMDLFPIPFYCCHASFKSLAHLNRYYVMEEAHRQGVDDCVTVTEQGFILEAAFGNVFWVKEKLLMTPDPSLPLYFGVTMSNVLLLASELGFDIEYVKMCADQLPKEYTAFRTNTMHGVRPIARIGKIQFNRDGDLESLFINGYEEQCTRECTCLLSN